MTLFDVAPFDSSIEQPVDIIAVCHRCGARSEPIPSDAGLGPSVNGWWPGIAFALLAINAHTCPEAPCTSP